MEQRMNKYPYKSILTYVSIRICLFIPLVWITYLINYHSIFELPIRIVLVFLSLKIFVIIGKYLIIKFPSYYNKSSNGNKYKTLFEEYKPRNLKERLIIPFSYSWLLLCINYESDPLDYSSCFLLFTFVFILNGSPFINNYKGFNGSSESSSNGEPIWIESSNKILVDKDEFKNLLKEGKFDDYEYLTTRSFIFKETGIVAGYYDPNYDYKPLSIMTFFLFPFLESVIKSAIWIPIYYLLLMLSPKVRKTYIEKMPDVKVITINV